MSAPTRDAVAAWFERFAEQGIFTTDERLVVTTWNTWLERHSGRPAAETVGRALFDLYPDLPVRGLDEHYHHALKGQAHLVSHLLHRYLLPIEMRVGGDELMTMPQRARIAPLTADGRIIGTITVIDDVSDRVLSEQELRKHIEAQRLARKAAETALRLKDEFLATLSHEIRTPLNAVLGWARILTDRDMDLGLVSRGLEAIARNATLQARLIDDLLDTARIMAGKLRLQMQPVDLVTVTTGAMEVMAPVLENKRMHVRTTFAPEIPRVLGDPDRLQQVVWNLLSNAAKFTDVGGTIDVRLEPALDRARITVRDTGKGIEPEFLPYVFDRFRQGDVSSSRREGGLGLGLALVRELVELHGGIVRAASEGPSRGAEFVVELPTMAPADTHATQPRTLARQRSGPLNGVHVLLVEDERDSRELFSTVLEGAGATVIAVGSCDEALAYFESDQPVRPSVIVSDIGMPERDGYELIRSVRRLPASRGGNLPAIAVTAYGSADDRSRALAAGYQVHMPKPVDPASLIAAVTSLNRRVDV
jgi:signal transduction histidine kinase/ActR/RegA family two-component response regulator